MRNSTSQLFPASDFHAFRQHSLLVVAVLLLLSACTSVKDDDILNTPSAEFNNSASEDATYSQEEVRIAAGNLFGGAAEKTGRLIERIFAKHGRPTAYIGGREISSAVFVGARYGEGTLHHKLEGQQPVSWIGPSVGFDFGMNGGETFQLVYNLYDPEQLFAWRPTGEGQAYMMGGFNVSYQHYKDIVVVTIKVGVGVRLGVNVGLNRYNKGPL